GRTLRDANCGIASGVNYIDVGFYKIGHQSRYEISVRPICPPIDREVLPLDETSSPQFIEHRDYNRRIAGVGGHSADAIGPPDLLSARDGYSKQRQRRCTPDKGNELPPPHWAPHGR